jgi:serine/threonine protein kinase
LGRGRWGETYRAQDLLTRREVVVKRLRTELSETHAAWFRQRAAAWAALEHPNLVRVLDFRSPNDELPYAVLERLEGGTLAELLASGAPCSTELAVDVLTGVARGLVEAHQHGIECRLLTPRNVFVNVTAGGTAHATIADFGIDAFRDPFEVSTATGASATDENITAFRPGEALGDREALGILITLLDERARFAGSDVPDVKRLLGLAERLVAGDGSVSLLVAASQIEDARTALGR